MVRRFPFGLKHIVWVTGLLGGGDVCIASPTGASLPYMPSWVARHQIERLIDDAGLQITATQWPLPAAAVEGALDALPPVLPPELDLARGEVRAELARTLHAGGTLRLRNRAEEPVGFDDDYTPGSSITLRSPMFGGEALGASLRGHLGLRVEQQSASLLPSSSLEGRPQAAVLRPEDSALVAGALGVNLEAFAHRDWWGPGWQSSLILGDNAPPWIGIGVQRSAGVASTSPLLSWLGPWSAEFFVAKAQDPKVIDLQASGFLFIGWRLTAKPTSFIELALSRTEQTAGFGRPGGWHNFWRALTASGTNADTVTQQSSDPGNEMAGFDLRVRCPFKAACAGYVQAIGEDQAGSLPSHYLALFGAETWTADGRYRWFVEYANATCRGLPWEHELLGCAYRNYQYQQGYTNGTRWAGASLGADSRLASIGWYAPVSERRLRLHWGYVSVSQGAYAPTLPDAPHGVLFGATLDQSAHWHGITLTGEAAYSHLSEGHDIDFNRRRNARVGLTVEKVLD